MVTSTEFTLTTTDNLHLHGLSCLPDGELIGVLCMVHGTGEHMGRYEHVVRYLNESGFATVTFDLRGHGKSEGPIAHSSHFDLLMSDIDLAVRKSGEISPSSPHFILGHSMGGNLVLNYVLRKKPNLEGVIALSPGLRTTVPTPKWKLAFGRVLYHLWPSLTLNNGVKAEDLSRDPEIARQVLNDPLYRFLISSRMGIDILEAGEWALEHAGDFPLPLLLMHGTSDKVTSSKATEKFASKVKVDCTLKLWDGFFHELTNEPEKEEVLGYLVEWMRKRIGFMESKKEMQ